MELIPLSNVPVRYCCRCCRNTYGRVEANTSCPLPLPAHLRPTTTLNYLRWVPPIVSPSLFHRNWMLMKRRLPRFKVNKSREFRWFRVRSPLRNTSGKFSHLFPQSETPISSLPWSLLSLMFQPELPNRPGYIKSVGLDFSTANFSSHANPGSRHTAVREHGTPPPTSTQESRRYTRCQQPPIMSRGKETKKNIALW